MSVVAITMVRDEEDIIDWTLQHLLDQGVDHIIVADNLSVDETPWKLAALASTGKVTVIQDDEPGYYQDKKMTDLAHMAAADFDAEGEDVGAEFFRFGEAGGVVGVEHDERVEVAVAGVEDVGDLEVVLGAHFADAAQDVGELGGGDGAVHAHVVWRDAADGTEGAFAAFPDGEGFLGGLADFEADWVVLGEDGFQGVEQEILFGGAAFDFDDEHGFGV